MAERKLAEIRKRAIEEFDIIEAAIVHRTGRIPVGGNIVLIVVGASHRREAFAACAWCINELETDHANLEARNHARRTRMGRGTSVGNGEWVNR